MKYLILAGFVTLNAFGVEPICAELTSVTGASLVNTRTMKVNTEFKGAGFTCRFNSRDENLRELIPQKFRIGTNALFGSCNIFATELVSIRGIKTTQYELDGSNNFARRRFDDVCFREFQHNSKEIRYALEDYRESVRDCISFERQDRYFKTYSFAASKRRCEDAAARAYPSVAKLIAQKNSCLDSFTAVKGELLGRAALLEVFLDLKGIDSFTCRATKVGKNFSTEAVLRTLGLELRL